MHATFLSTRQQTLSNRLHELLEGSTMLRAALVHGTCAAPAPAMMQYFDYSRDSWAEALTRHAEGGVDMGQPSAAF